MPKWIEFREQPQIEGRKTERWMVVSRESGGSIGRIEWSTRWRRYCFYPDGQTMFEWQCLRDIAEKLEAETVMHNNRLKQRKTASGVSR